MGWMQFIPSTWAAYGVDANEDGRKDPYNPVDAICAAARYLRAAGGDHDIRQAIFSYNHADWYVDEVLLYANQYGRLPDALVGSLTGLTEGAHFPVAADARYADDINDAAALARSTTQRKAAGNAADVISSNASRRSINIYSAEALRSSRSTTASSRRWATVQGARQVHRPPGRLRQSLHVLTSSGDRRRSIRSRARRSSVPGDFKLEGAEQGRGAEEPGDRGRQRGRRAAAQPAPRSEPKARKAGAEQRSQQHRGARERLFALPERSANGASELRARGPARPAARPQRSPARDRARRLTRHVQFDPKTMQLKPLKVGSQVIGGSVIGRVGKTDPQPAAPQLRDPPGRPRRPHDRPEADPRRLEAARDHRDLPGRRQEPVRTNPTVGQVLLMSKAALMQRVLARPEALDLRLRPQGHRRPARSTAASSRSWSTWSPRATASRSPR